MNDFGITHDVQTRVTSGTTNPRPTNADRIRAMSDKELAEVIECPHGLDLEICSGKGTCLDCCIDWLRQPAGEGKSSRTHKEEDNT